MGQATLRTKMRYRVDNFLSRGSSALFIALVFGFIGSLFGLSLLRFALHLVDPDTAHSVWRHVWTVFLELTDPGNMNQDNETPGVFKPAAVMAGLTGVVIFSALIAFLTTALDQAIAHLKKGHSDVVESDHTLILGWGVRVVEILNELVEANESEDDPVVVILADIDKEEMDEHLRSNFTDRRNMRLVTRSGPTASLAALGRVATAEAKSVIVLGTCDPSADQELRLESDARVIKTVLALDTFAGPEAEFNIVAEIFAPRNRTVVADIRPGRVAVVDAEEILAKIMVQTSRTSGLSVVYSELLSFKGCEMYFHEAEWGNRRFNEIQYHFEDGVPIGVRRAEGELIVRPPADYVMGEGDEILIIADDDSTIDFQALPIVAPIELPIPNRRVEQKRERMLIMGWSPKAPIIINEYSDYVLEGSQIQVMCSQASTEVAEKIAELSACIDEVSVSLIEGDPLVSADLEAVDPWSYDNIIILPQHAGDLDPERIDAETIVVLLHLRKLQRDPVVKERAKQVKLITEVLDSANQELINQAGVNDFIISNQKVSMIFAQLSEEPGIQQVYDDLFEEDGSEIYVKPAELYFDTLPFSCRFGDLMALTQKRDGEICIGVKFSELDHDSQQNFGIQLIPPKDQVIKIKAGDALVVVAEDDR